jgi:Flp pilus assembly CpaE family ATPase
MANVLSKPVDEIRPRLLEGELVAHPSGLRALLSSPRAREAALQYAPDAETVVVRALRTMGRPAVFDLGPGLNPIVTRLHREMDQFILVVDPIPVTLAMAREILNEIDASRPENSRTHVVVVNRAASSVPPSWQDVEQYLGREIRAIVSLASELVSQALQASAPVVLYQPTAIASSQLIKLAEDMHVRYRVPSAGGEVTP